MERHCTREREANSPIDRGPPLVFKSNTLRVSTFINVYYHSLDNESPINYHAPINGRAESTNESRTGFGSVFSKFFISSFLFSSFLFCFICYFICYFTLFILIFLYELTDFILHVDFLKCINVQIHWFTRLLYKYARKKSVVFWISGSIVVGYCCMTVHFDSYISNRCVCVSLITALIFNPLTTEFCCYPAANYDVKHKRVNLN